MILSAEGLPFLDSVAAAVRAKVETVLVLNAGLEKNVNGRTILFSKKYLLRTGNESPHLALLGNCFTKKISNSMKAPFRFGLTLSILLGAATAVFAQSNPCLCIETESKNCATLGGRVTTPFDKNGSRAVSFSVTSDPLPAADALDKFAGARYKAFWMFGDGNFRYFAHLDSLSDVGTLNQNYTYRRNGKYRVEASLSEKKSNTKPPARTIREVEVKNTTEGAGSDFSKTLQGNNKTADVLPSDSMRPHGYRTAFAVSAPKDPSNTGIYFFYNALVSGSTVSATPLVHERVDVNLPDYAGGPYTEGLTSALGNSLGTALQTKFANYIYFPIPAGSMGRLPADFTEYRIFPILKTIWTNKLPKCQFLAVVVGSSAVVNIEVEGFSAGARQAQDPGTPTTVSTFYTPEKIEALQSSMINTLGDDFSLDAPIAFDTFQKPIYLRGIGQATVPMVGSIDPNELEVISICPKDAGKYTVTMRVQVCNRGEIPENYVPVRIIDHTGGEISDFQFLNPDPAKLDSLSWDATNRTWRFVWKDGLPGVYTPGDLPPGAKGAYEPQCMEVYFTVTTTLAGAQKLMAGEGLESCATFPGASAIGIPDECHYNFEVNGTFTAANGYACGDPDTGGFSCNWLCILLILCILAILIWWWFWKKDE
jgi:hypothetical protein